MVSTRLRKWVYLRRYESIDPELLPPLWLIYAANPSDSGAIHSDVRRRWKEGDPDVIAAMANFARIAQQGRCACAGLRCGSCCASAVLPGVQCSANCGVRCCWVPKIIAGCHFLARRKLQCDVMECRVM
jgi:hypothetical protein